jgi:hypothetical protein
LYCTQVQSQNPLMNYKILNAHVSFFSLFSFKAHICKGPLALGIKKHILNEYVS